MEYVRLGTTGLEASRLVLGCMSFGDPTGGGHPWTLDEETSRPLIRQAVEAEINFFDTATYSPLPDPPLGSIAPSEENLEALHDVVKASKGVKSVDEPLAVLQAHCLAPMAGLMPFVSMPQPAQPRRGAGDAAAVRTSRSRCHSWSPLAREKAYPLDEETTSSQTDEFGSNLDRSGRSHRGDRLIVEQVARVATARQLP